MARTNGRLALPLGETVERVLEEGGFLAVSKPGEPAVWFHPRYRTRLSMVRSNIPGSDYVSMQLGDGAPQYLHVDEAVRRIEAFLVIVGSPNRVVKTRA